MKGSKREWHGSRLRGVLDLCGWDGVGGASSEEKERRETEVTLPQDGIAFIGTATLLHKLTS